MMQVSQLYIYPIKSLGGIAVTVVNITDRGFEYDRRWMLVDENNRFLSQREIAEMALLKVTITGNGLAVQHLNYPGDVLRIPFPPYCDEKIAVQVWDVFTKGTLVSKTADDWFSSKLSVQCRLVYMNDEEGILIDEQYNINNSINSFSDGFPILMISEASLEDLNSRLTERLPMNRFRPNLVISGSTAFGEDNMREFAINHIHFYGVKPCARCIIPTTDQSTGIRGKEPLKTLSTYRNINNKIYFGENVIALQPGRISVGDGITVIETKQTVFDK